MYKLFNLLEIIQWSKEVLIDKHLGISQWFKG